MVWPVEGVLVGLVVLEELQEFQPWPAVQLVDRSAVSRTPAYVAGLAVWSSLDFERCFQRWSAVVVVVVEQEW